MPWDSTDGKAGARMTIRKRSRRTFSVDDSHTRLLVIAIFGGRPHSLTMPRPCPTCCRSETSTGAFFRHMTADNGQVLLGSRNSSAKRITLFNSDGAASFGDSTLSGWTDRGVYPGISDDGRAITFYGEDAKGPHARFPRTRRVKRTRRIVRVRCRSPIVAGIARCPTSASTT